MEKEIFNQEQNHLSDTYDKLLKMRDELKGQIRELNEKAVDDKNDIRDNIRIDYADIETTMETLTEIEVWNRYIDTYNVESSSLTKRLGTVEKLLESPYFARIQLQFDPSEEPEDYYIGRAAITENGYEQLIIDWRSPVAEVYYNQESGPTHYTVDDREIPVDLKLRRQFDLKRNELLSYFDTQIAIEDPLLLESLAQTRSDKMTAITATIQKEQNTIIRYPDVPVLLVDGIAGSGKTSVLLQRIAYLFYKKRNTLRPDQVCLMTLNPVFRDYIDNVLPDLGETNPVTLTWQEFLEMAELPFRSDDIDYTDAKSLLKIRDVLPTLRLTAEDFYDIRQKEMLVISKAEIMSTVKRFSKLPTGMRLIQTVADELEERAKNTIKDLDSETDEGYEGTARSGHAKENRIENDYGGALSNIRHCSFVNISHIAERILGSSSITAAEWLYTRMELTGLCDRNVKYVMIDEVQDYTKAQLMLFWKYFPNARFMLLGDEFQSIREGTVSFAEIEEMTSGYKKKAVTLPLLTSYRSSPEITDMFSLLLPARKKMLVSSVQRPGEKTDVHIAGSEEEFIAVLKDKLKEYGSREGLTAVICRDPFRLENISELLGDASPSLIANSARLPKSGAFLIDLALAKGLEFDHVIIADADPETYPDTDLGRHCLYTAISRAIRHLSVLTVGSLTPNLLNKVSDA